LREDSRKDRIIVLTGCTASGKTSLIKKISEYYPIEVISCDSRQIYKYMDIGTAKPDKETIKKVQHHLIDIKYPDEYFSAFDFYSNVKVLKNEIRERGNIPVIVGGTILYLISTQNGLFKIPKIERKIKDELRKEMEIYGINKLYKELREIDPERAKEIHPNDKQRILRSLEIYKGTGIRHSEWIKREHHKGFNLVIFYLFCEMDELKRRIEERVNKMIEMGFREEVLKLLEMGYKKDDYGMTSLGYREMIEHIEGKTNIDETIKKIVKKTKDYAKRQRSFIKKLMIQSKITLDNFQEFIKILNDEKENKNR